MAYNYLKNADNPKIIKEAFKLLGVREVLGKDHNPTILKWAEELGLKNVYASDEVPWCGLFVAYVCKKADKTVVTSPLWARNWLNFGTKEATPKLGDILVFSRGTGGHVGFYVGEDDKCYHVLGGNQGDAVSVTRIVKTRLLGARRPIWTTAEPSSVKVIKLEPSGAISTNEI